MRALAASASAQEAKRRETSWPELTKLPSDTHSQTKPERAWRIIEIDQMLTDFRRSGRGERGLTA